MSAESLLATSKSQLTVYGWNRQLQHGLNLNVPNDVLLVIIMFYPNHIQFEENSMNLTINEKELIAAWIQDIFKLKNSTFLRSQLLYDYKKDEKTAHGFHKKCNGYINTLSIVQTGYNGHIFGCFLSEKIPTSGLARYIPDDKAFLCIIRPSFEDTLPAIFRIKQNYEYNAYWYSQNCGPVFGANELTIFGDTPMGGTGNTWCCHRNTKFEGDLCGNMLCGGYRCEARDKKYGFWIKEMNTFTIIIEDK